MSSCILFASTILNHEREFVLRRFLETFKTNFNTSDLYIGINPNSISNTESIIEEYNLNAQTIRVTPELYCESDASAYQAALRLLYDSKKQYDTYWFVHTKSGVNNHSDYLREWYIDNFLLNKNTIESFMIDNDMGSYGMLGLEYDPNKIYTETDVEIKLWENEITENLPYSHSNFFYIHTIYAISQKPINNFFNLITNKWFETKLDRYYFEGVFPFIVSRSGYFQYLENLISMTGQDLSHAQLDWLKTNNLEEKYTNHLNKFKTNYPFHQLNPPYVNSNSKS
jgi:hypothetical protein